MQVSIGVAAIILVVIVIAFVAYRDRSGAPTSTGCSDGDECTAPAGCVSGACAACTNDGDCQTTGTTQCSAAGQCVECTDNSGCTDASLPQCNPSGRCVAGCTADSDCATGLYCNTYNGTCVQCASPEHCTAPLGCYGDVCTSCNNNSNCQAATPVCNVGGQCVKGCAADTDCTDASLPHCVNGQCAECKANSDCPSSGPPNCNISGQCVASCTTDSDCTVAGLTHCNTRNNTCVECASPEHCTAPDGCYNDVCTGCVSSADCQAATPVCNSGHCVVGCTKDSDCPTADMPHCNTYNNTCVECASPEHCTAPKGCYGDVCTSCNNNADCQTATPVCTSGQCVAS